MNLQTVDDLIEELQRLDPVVRKRPVRLAGVSASFAIVVENKGPYTELRVAKSAS